MELENPGFSWLELFQIHILDDLFDFGLKRHSSIICFFTVDIFNLVEIELLYDS